MFQECTRKESEYASNAALFKEKYQSVCKQMSIKVRILICVFIYGIVIVLVFTRWVY